MYWVKIPDPRSARKSLPSRGRYIVSPKKDHSLATVVNVVRSSNVLSSGWGHACAKAKARDPRVRHSSTFCWYSSERGRMLRSMTSNPDWREDDFSTSCRNWTEVKVDNQSWGTANTQNRQRWSQFPAEMRRGWTPTVAIAFMVLSEEWSRSFNTGIAGCTNGYIDNLRGIAHTGILYMWNKNYLVCHPGRVMLSQEIPGTPACANYNNRTLKNEQITCCSYSPRPSNMWFEKNPPAARSGSSTHENGVYNSVIITTMMAVSKWADNLQVLRCWKRKRGVNIIRNTNSSYSKHSGSRKKVPGKCLLSCPVCSSVARVRPRYQILDLSLWQCGELCGCFFNYLRSVPLPSKADTRALGQFPVVHIHFPKQSFQAKSALVMHCPWTAACSISVGCWL